MPNSLGESDKAEAQSGRAGVVHGRQPDAHPNIAMIAAACGFDGVYIDLEHNPRSLETAAAICVAALGPSALHPSPVSAPATRDATRILDCSAQGVMVPHVSTVAEARAVVESCRYPALGHRSASSSGPARGYAARSQGEINAYLNEQTLLIAMLETPEAIENADAIAAVDAIGRHPHRVLRSQHGNGHSWSINACAHAFGYEVTAKAARSHGKSFGVGGVRENLEFQTWLIELGMRYLTGGSDVGYILSAGRADVKRIREVRLS